jgi:hypothetical protein
MRYISIVLLLSFTVTSSYGAVGLRTTPIRALADGSQVDGTHPRLNVDSTSKCTFCGA